MELNRALYEREKRILNINELKREFTKIRNDANFYWLKEVSRHVEANALRDLDRAYKNFFRRLKSGLKGGMPKFKAKGKVIPSFCTRSERVYVDEQGSVYLEKIGHVRCKSKENLRGFKFFNVRIKFENGRWLMKCSVNIDSVNCEKNLRAVNMGIDVGVKSLAVVSCGGNKRVFRNINRNHKMRRLSRQLKHLQRSLARKKKGSRNHFKTLCKVRKIYGRIKRIRHDYIQKTAHAIVSMKPSVIVLEDLNIRGMMKNRYIARAVAEQKLHMFRELVKDKAEKAGITVMYAGRFFPSSKKCSNCGHVREKLKLSERVYKCPECGLVIDRDFNAARNLEKLAS